MRRLATSFLALLTTLTAALVPGAAVFAQPGDDGACAPGTYGHEMVVQAELEASMIAIGRVRAAGEQFALEPEAFLKGPAQPDALPLPSAPQGPCGDFGWNDGERVLVFFEHPADDLAPRDARDVYRLSGGSATSLDGSISTSESQLVRDIRAITEQYAVPAAGEDEGAEIDWWKTVLPVGAATVGLLGVGLYLMRIWHRIDPS